MRLISAQIMYEAVRPLALPRHISRRVQHSSTLRERQEIRSRALISSW